LVPKPGRQVNRGRSLVRGLCWLGLPCPNIFAEMEKVVKLRPWLADEFYAAEFPASFAFD